jgi:hypothetical protein
MSTQRFLFEFALFASAICSMYAAVLVGAVMLGLPVP